MEAAGVLACTFGLGYLLQSGLSALNNVSPCRGHYHHKTAEERAALCTPRRFGLLVFLISASIWASLFFAIFMITSDIACNISTVFVAIFDQLSRVSLIGVGLWGVRGQITDTAERGTLIIFIVLRFVLGIAVTAFTRSTFIPVCFPQATSSMRHGRMAGVSQLAFDGVMLTIMLVRAWTAWSSSRRRGADSKKGAGLVMIIIAMKIWNLAIIPYIVKLGSVFVRLAPTIISLAILLGLIRAYPDAFWFLLYTDLDNSSSDGRMRLGSEPINPGGTGMAYRDPESNRITRSHVTQESSGSGRHRSANSSLFRSIIGLPAPTASAPWGMRSEQGTLKRQTRFAAGPSGALMTTKSTYIETKHPPHAGGISKISGPILKNGGFGPADGIPGGDNVEPFAGMRTVSLRTAGETERARVDEQFEEEEESRRKELQIRQSIIQTPRTIASFAGLPSHLNQQRRATLRKANASMLRDNTMRSQQTTTEGRIVLSEDIISPRSQMGYRISNTTFSTENDTVKQMFSNAENYALSVPPRTLPRGSMISGDRRVLLLNNIEYDDPVLVNSIIEEQKQRHSLSLSTGFAQPPSNGVLRRSPLTTHAEEKGSCPTTPVMERKRGAGLKRTESRKLFPRESVLSPELFAPLKLETIYDEKLPPPPPPPTEPLPAPPMPRALHKRSTSASSKASSKSEYLQPPPPMPALGNQHMDSRDSSSTADPYEMAKAWVASAVPVQQKFAHPELVDVSISRENSLSRRESQATFHTTSNTSGYGGGIRQTSLTMSMITSSELTGSTVLADDDEDDATGVIPVYIPKSEQTFLENETGDESSEAGSSTTQAQSLHTPNDRDSFEQVALSPYMPSPQEVDAEDYYTSRNPVPSDISYNGYLSDENEYEYSDLEDDVEKIQSLQRILHQNIHELTDALPKPKKLGDSIPTFLTRGLQAYGQKRKQPPVSLGEVPLRQEYRQQLVAPAPPKAPTPAEPVAKTANAGIAARLTMLMGAVQQPEALEDNIIRHLPSRLLTAPPNNDKRNSNISSGRNSLLRQLENEASQQESQWIGLRKSLHVNRDSLASYLSTPESMPSNRRSLLEKVHKGIERRLSRQEAEIKIVDASDDEELESSPTPLTSRAMVTNEFYMHGNLALSNASLTYSLAETLEESELSSADDEKPQLWTAPVMEEVSYVADGKLWAGEKASKPTGLPAAIGVRPMKRFDDSILAISSIRLWTLPKMTVNMSRNSQLWAQPKNNKPRGILSMHRRASSAKRVTFSEDIMAVDTSTGVERHYKKLIWGLSVPVPPVPKPAVRTINGTPISAILDTIAKKYERKALPELPKPGNSGPSSPSTPRKRPTPRPLGLATMTTGASAADNRPKSFIAPSVPPKRHSRSKSKDLRIDLEVIRQSELLGVGSAAGVTPSPFDATPVVASAKVVHRARASLIMGMLPPRKNDDADKQPSHDRQVASVESVQHPARSSRQMMSLVNEDQQQRQEAQVRDLPVVPAASSSAWWESRHKSPTERRREEQALAESDMAQHIHEFPTPPAPTSASDGASDNSGINNQPLEDNIIDNSQLWKTSSSYTPPPSPTRRNMLSTAPPQLWSKTVVQSQPPTTVPDLFKKSPTPAPRAKQSPRPDPPRATGSLWTKPSTEESPKELWKPTASKGLWSQDGETVTLADLAAARREVAELWKKERDEPTLFKKTNEEVVCVTSRKERETQEIVSSEEEAVKKQTTLWVAPPPPPPPKKIVRTSTWTADSDAPDLFSHLPTTSLARSKKETSTQTLPVFSEDLWKASVPLPPQPSLWTPPPKPSLLWSSRTGAPVAALPHLAADLKHSQKTLWTRRTASRTTTATPPQRTRTPFIPPTTPLPIVSGTLWKRPSPAAPKGLWKRNVRRKTVASETIPPRTPLWSKHTARRTTTSIPERGETIKKPTDTRALPVFQGPMWTKPSSSASTSLWTASQEPAVPQLWSQAPERRSAIPKPERIPPVQDHDHSSDSLWTPAPSDSPNRASLWTPPAARPSSPPHDDETPKSPLWAPHKARRFTDSKPTRGTPVPRKPSDAVLKKATGGLWGEGEDWGLSRASTFESAVESDDDEEEEEMRVRVRDGEFGSVSSVGSTEQEGKVAVMAVAGGFGGLWAKVKEAVA